MYIYIYNMYKLCKDISGVYRWNGLWMYVILWNEVLFKRDILYKCMNIRE
jgi:hypothetical protein